MPKISVVIPAYNAMAYLPETLENLLQQTWQDFEVIVVNDGSSDDTPQWVAEVRDPRVKLVSQENQGLAGARNTGIAHAQGEYIAFLDADDLWEKTKLEKQLQSLEQNPNVGLVYTWVLLIDAQGKKTGRVFKSEAQGKVWQTLIEENIVGCGSVAMVRRECFETCGLFDRNLKSFVEDWDMWLRIASHYQFSVVPEPLVYYRQHANSASRNWSAMEESYKIVIEKAFDSAPLEVQDMKNKSYGRAYLCLAWKPLQSAEKDYQTAAKFREIAITYYPQLIWTKEYWRLSLAIVLMRSLGPDRYQTFLQWVYSLRRQIFVLK
ncbi:glycosyltransferase family 2 protein [Roseofilum capinflatum]|uniref:Glycosyltransferase family A protein n=1 Tax=Roseofilum capinflatum BLCC-M114 TaxID=3022440 RepID=A0ABT7B0M3_9CYAN|nr:glycosyltransferase family A protein [Roseofilum capinflatum]MDJ1172689.1 glycosyltransferase family A protein [Roseofilum capinflatum BLCC-M114]